MIEDPKTPGIQVKKPEHPLQYTWTIYHDTKSSKFPPTPAPPVSSASDSTSFHQTESTDYEAGLTVVGSFATVEEFCRYFNWLKPPSHLERNSNYHLFKSGIKPMWEDPANANGGKWVLTMKNNPQLLDRCWNWLVMALVGEELEEGHDEICGAVVSLRAKVDRIQVWTRGKDDVERLNGIGKKLVKLLDISEADGIGLEFQFNTEDRPQPNKFLSIQAMPQSGFRNSFHGPPGSGAPFHQPPRQDTASPVGGPQSAVSNPNASAFGGFGVGMGGPGWRVPKRG
ncbi:translation initiation factor eIF 4e-like domain-containing protein [Schizophyllum commune]|nr:translation initiation factor eIF4e [Schizophyllum commune Loenen D]KAI5824714.1 translation initiation factor eIF4e [Schizophyllum commune Tattone D]